jgi:hypothetical protein
MEDALYAGMIFTGLYAATNYKNLMQGTYSPKAIVALVVGCAVLAGSRTKCHKVIVALTVQEILDEHIAKKLA